MGLSEAYYSLFPGSNDQKTIERVGGLCIFLAFKGIYYRRHWELADKIKLFMSRNNLTPRDDIYIMPLQNHWYNQDIEEYITQLILPVTNNDCKE